MDDRIRLHEEYNFLINQAYDDRFPKKFREQKLREARKIGKELGIEGENYNG